jgi:hypothetical protein
MFTFPEAPGEGKGSIEVGPAPYQHRSDFNICRKQDGLKTGSALEAMSLAIRAAFAGT